MVKVPIKTKDKPHLEFLYQLQRINQIYNSYDDIETKEDIERLIYHYQQMDSFSKDELKRLQGKCQKEWKELLIRVCNSIIKKVGTNKSKKILFAEEFDEAQELLQKIKNNKMRLEGYEQLFDNSIQILKRKFDSKWEKEHIEWKRFWIGLFVGLIGGFVLGLIGGYILFGLGYA